MADTHSALIYTMVLVSAADRNMTDSELKSMGEIVRYLPVFRNYDPDSLPKTAKACADLLGDDQGLDKALDIIVDSLPPGRPPGRRRHRARRPSPAPDSLNRRRPRPACLRPAAEARAAPALPAPAPIRETDLDWRT